MTGADVDRFTIASRLRDPVTGEGREVRIVVDREHGVTLELMEAATPFAITRADVTQWGAGAARCPRGDPRAAGRHRGRSFLGPSPRPR